LSPRHHIPVSRNTVGTPDTAHILSLRKLSWQPEARKGNLPLNAVWCLSSAMSSIFWTYCTSS
jgi:hypothetical protein